VRAGFFRLRNTSRTSREIVSASSPWFERIEMHRTVVREGQARMEPIESVTVPAGKEVRFVPGGNHLMLIAPRDEVRAGGAVPIELRFGDGTYASFDLEARSNSFQAQSASP
jgi:copper(I)-binding protein